MSACHLSATTREVLLIVILICYVDNGEFEQQSDYCNLTERRRCSLEKREDRGGVLIDDGAFCVGSTMVPSMADGR